MHQVKRVDKKTKQGFENKFLFANFRKILDLFKNFKATLYRLRR